MKTDIDNDPVEQDIDPQETREWKEALEEVIERDGPERAHFLIESLVDKARRSGAYLPYNATTAYVNTIPVHQEEQRKGDPALERRIKSIIRWNAMAMVVRANRERRNLAATSPPIVGGEPVGGGLQSFLSRARCRERWRSGDDSRGTARPGIYARAFLEGRLTEEQLRYFRREVDKKAVCPPIPTRG